MSEFQSPIHVNKYYYYYTPIEIIFHWVNVLEICQIKDNTNHPCAYFSGGEKLNLDARTIVRENDGWEIDEDRVLERLDSQTNLVLLREDEEWTQSRGKSEPCSETAQTGKTSIY